MLARPRSSSPLPLWERVARAERVTGEGVMSLVMSRPLIRRFAPPSPTRGEGKRAPLLLLRFLDRQDLERRGVGLDAERVVRDQPDLAQRRLFEVAIIRLAHRILPDADRALGDEQLGDTAGILAFKLRQFV